MSSTRLIQSRLALSLREFYYSPPRSAQSLCRYISNNVNTFTDRTHTCGQLSTNELGRRVQLVGWVQYTRFDNKIVVLRDSYGSTQCIADKASISSYPKKLSNESVVKISGTVRRRPEGQVNPNMSTGEIEVVTDNLEVLSQAKKQLPILSRDEDKSNLINRLRYRYLDLRSKEMQNNLRFRSKACKIIRDKLYSLDFVECETPTLFNRTPGGANEFIVPTQTPNKFYSLVQSPQQLKQLLMIGGLDRYFQICRCYRDELGRSDRQPEFTQVDIELSFTNQEAVMQLSEELIVDLSVNLANDIADSKALVSSVDKPFGRIKYSDSMKIYGSDKPDIRFECYIEQEEDGRLRFDVPLSIDEAELASIRDQLQVDSSIVMENRLNEGVLRVKSGDSTEESRKIMGTLRKNLADELDIRGRSLYKSRFAFTWVTDFPLFVQDESNNLQTNHHPFTAPTPESSSFLDQEPLKVAGQHYDLVLNGQEIAGGSIRIHDPVQQRKIFQDLLNLDTRMFDYFIEALESGCPPHGGIAIGLDRTLAILLGKQSIREVIAFPKAASGRDLLVQCPHELSSDVKRLYHID